MSRRENWSKEDYQKELIRVDNVIKTTKKYFCKIDHLKYRKKIVNEMETKYGE